MCELHYHIINEGSILSIKIPNYVERCRMHCSECKPSLREKTKLFTFVFQKFLNLDHYFANLIRKLDWVLKWQSLDQQCLVIQQTCVQSELLLIRVVSLQ